MRLLSARAVVHLPKINPRCYSTAIDPKSEDYQYLQKSYLPQNYFQKSLPRLPIPELTKTMERYLSAQKPLSLNDEHYKEIEQVARNFGLAGGLELDKILKDTDKLNKHTSYISGPWFEMYLQDRSPIPVNNTPLLLMNKDPKSQYNDQAIRSTNLIVTSLRFMRSLRAEYLDPEVYHMNAKKSDTDKFRKIVKLAPSLIATYVAYAFKAFPLDMSQYAGLFAGTRIPELGKDRIYRNQESRHLAVVINGQFYAVDVLNEDGTIKDPAFINSQLRFIINNAPPKNPHPLGAMTTENRDTWAKARKNLVGLSNKNAANLEMIDSALFCLCLDDTLTDYEKPVGGIRNFLFDEGANRWFDKSFSLIVSKDGTAGVTFEHSWGDGVAVLRYFNEVWKETTTKPFWHPDSKASVDIGNSVRPLEFDLDDGAKNSIDLAQKNHQSVINSIDMNFLKYDGLNKEVCKNHKISPDAVMQLSFQLGFYKQHKQFVTTYESCSTAVFRHGRTETMRPCTNETREFCEKISSQSPPSNSELRSLIEKCSNKHNALTKDAAMGQGFDRHLFGLRYIANLNGIKLPQLFLDPAYAKMNHNILSTSTLTSPALLAGGFGPVVKDGYGIAYQINNEYLGCVLANYKNTRNGPEFIECLRESYDDIGKVLQGN